MRYKIWDKQEHLITPIGEVLSPAEVFNKYPMAGLPNFRFVICDAPVSMGVFMEFEQTKMHYTQLGVPITEEMTDQQVLDAISYWEENPPTPQPSPEERMAAAMEFQAMMTIPPME